MKRKEVRLTNANIYILCVEPREVQRLACLPQEKKKRRRKSKASNCQNENSALEAKQASTPTEIIWSYDRFLTYKRERTYSKERQTEYRSKSDFYKKFLYCRQGVLVRNAKQQDDNMRGKKERRKYQNIYHTHSRCATRPQ